MTSISHDPSVRLTATPHVVATHQGCPSAGEIALAVMWQSPRSEQQVIADHVSHCEACQNLRSQLAERLATWAGRFFYKSHLSWLQNQSWLAPYRKYIQPDALPGVPDTRILDRRFTLVQFAESVRHLTGSTVECGVLRGV